MNTTILHPFSKGFLSQFVWTPQTQPFTNEEILLLDRELSEYEQVFLNPDIERNLISKNELLASFAISKAEDSRLTLKEAQDVYSLLLSEPDYDFVAKLLKAKLKLTQKDYDQLEFFNVAKTFRKLNQEHVKIEEITPERVKELHRNLTQGLDVFQQYLSGFTVYRSGRWRNNDTIRVGSYTPAPFTEIEEGVEKLVEWLKKNQTVDGVAIFHTALYGLHAFNNGNKRVCRILEHALLRNLGINSKNLYGTSYYYHKQKARYYKYLLYSLERRNLNHFVNFMLEALMFSMFDVVKTSLKTKRSEFLDRQELEGQIHVVLKPFIKRGEIQFKNLVRANRSKMARQTLVTYLQRAVEQDILKKRESGRATYYRLNFDSPELKTLKKWLDFAKKRLTYIPDNIKLI